MPTSTPNIHFLPAGSHTDINGVSVDFSEQNLAATVAAYDPAKHEAPLVIGHPKLNAPAYGWVKSLQLAADGAEAIPHQVNPDFAELRESGAYKKVSASFYPPDSQSNPVPGVYYLRHIGFLGAMPPAIKGLREPQFSEGESDADFITIEFSEPEQPEETAVTPEQAAALEAQNKQLAADLAACEAQLKKLQAAQAQENPDEDTTVTPEQAAALEAQNKQLAADLAARDKLLADERAARAKEAADRAHANNVAFAEKLATDTRIGKDHVPLVAAVLTQLQQPTGDADKPVEFGEGDDAAPLHTAVSEMLEQLPERVEFGETATKRKAAGEDDADDDTVEYAEGSDPEAIELDKKIRAHMKKHKCDYITAAHAVGNK